MADHPDVSSKSSDPDDLREQIEDFYLPRELVQAIYRFGRIPEETTESVMGVGFLDIVQYSYISDFLTPRENQAVLNGLYTVFNLVLKNHGGYLNKIEGDSMMFHFGGMLDPRIADMSIPQQERYVAQELFYTCVELQRFAAWFNDFNEKFLANDAGPDEQSAMQEAFAIIRTLRTTFGGSKMNTKLQFRIRVGASIGTVNVGNFGPPGRKQWDVIGVPIIEAKRMETSAPVDGLRITHDLYQKLKDTGVVRDYVRVFKRSATMLNGRYRDASEPLIFAEKEVIVKGKRSREFNTYSVQVDFRLPERVQERIRTHFGQRDAESADVIIDMVKYYRGNQPVTDAIEEVFSELAVNLRKHRLLELIYPNTFQAFRTQYSEEHVEDKVAAQFSLLKIFTLLGEYQDLVRGFSDQEGMDTNMITYQERLEAARKHFERGFEEHKKTMVQRGYFFNVVYPLVFESIRASIIEAQREAPARRDELREVTDPDLEDLGELEELDAIPLEELDEAEELEDAEAVAVVEDVEAMGAPIAEMGSGAQAEDPEELEELEVLEVLPPED